MPTILLFLVDWLICIVCMMLLSCLVALAVADSASRPDAKLIQVSSSLLLPFAVKNFGWLLLISGVSSLYFQAFISEFLIHMMATLLPIARHVGYIACMVSLSWLVLAIAHRAIEDTRVWWPELIHTSIIGLTLLLLNMMWGSPFEKPSSASSMKSALVGIAGYLIYVVYSMSVSYNYFSDSLLPKTFVVSLTFALLDMFVKPCTVSDMIDTLVGLAGRIATTLLPLFILVALSLVVFAFLHTWAEILLPSITRNYPRRTFVSIAGFTFMVMQTVLAIPVEEPSLFLDMKAGLLGITDMINKYQGAYMVIKGLTVLVIPLLSRESRPMMYTTAAIIVALSLLPPGPGTPTEYPASTLVTDDFVQQTITSFVTSQITGTDGEIKQLTDS